MRGLVAVAGALLCLLAAGSLAAGADPEPTPGPPDAVGVTPAPPEPAGAVEEQPWNVHAQSTVVEQWHPAFRADYSGPQSLSSLSENRETVSVDVTGGLRLWRGAEAYVDGLSWQGFGLSKTFGVAGFPSGEAYRVGTYVPAGTVARLFLRQTIGLGGPQEPVADDPLQLAGRRDIARVTLTVGEVSVKDLFDNNAYANDTRTQFQNWSLVANGAWDFPANSLGYTTGFAVEWNEPQWALRYGLFQIPVHLNGMTLDTAVLQAWGMVTEGEGRYTLGGHPGVVRGLAFLNRGHMGEYQAALTAPARPADTTPFRAGYTLKYGVGLNAEQELVEGLGLFARLGWSNGQTDSWMFTDVDRTASLGVSVKGGVWQRPADTVGLAGVLNGISAVHQAYFAAGGEGILLGDGALAYGWEKLLEVYYDAQLWQTLHAALDYQYVVDPGYNRARGPVSIVGVRVHWSF
jgi:high affinity Mn2+ porin